MAVGAWTFYNKFKRNLGQAFPINLGTGNFRIALYTSASNAATATLSIISSVTSEVTEANGYSSSGKPLASKTWTAGASGGQLRFNAAATVWTGTGGTISNIKFAVIWASGASAIARKLICYSQLSTSQFNLTINNTLTITPAATGIFNLAG
jgi:hypothetical protein